MGEPSGASSSSPEGPGGTSQTGETAPVDKPKWWAISEPALRDLLRRAHHGEDPEVLLLEQYANSDHEEVDPDA